MVESLCSCCKLLGKPPAEINFILVAGQPNNLICPRVKNLLRTYSETSSYEDDVRFTDYESLMSISNQLFNQSKNSPTIEKGISTKTCCQGITMMIVDVDNESNTIQLDDFQENIRDLLGLKTDRTPEETDAKSVPFTWIMISGFECFEPAVLELFLRLTNENSFLFTFSFTVLCFLVDEQQLFKNWFFQDLPIDNYQSETYPEYEHRVKDFFKLLNSSKTLQERTLLMNEQHFPTDNDLQKLLQSIYCSNSSNYRANNDGHRLNMAKLLVPRRRTMRDVRTVRTNLQRSFNRPTEDRLKPLLDSLKARTTPAALNAARQISQIVLDEFGRMNDEAKRVYKRQLMLGNGKNDVEFSNTITAQLIYLALHLLETSDDSLTPLIYSVILVIRRLSGHFIFRHQLFNHTPDIFRLSLLLIDRRQYSHTLSGLRLCSMILDGDQIEHKYGLMYLKHDPISARKILDAIKWLLTPYLDLKKLLWKEERNREETKEENSEHSGSTEEESAVHIAERFCFRHTCILVERSYIGSLASLFYSSTDHCVQVTKDDIHMFAQVIDVLVDPAMLRWSRGENKTPLSLVLISELCELLMPILLHCSPSVHGAFLEQNSFLTVVPRAITYMLQIKTAKEDMIKVCLRFYTHFAQVKCKQLTFVDVDVRNEEKTEPSEELDTQATKQPTESLMSLNRSKDLIAAYFNLNCQIQEMCTSDGKSEQQEEFRKLLEEEWKKLDIQQLQCDHKQLNDKYQLLEGELARVRAELQRTQVEKEHLRQENIQLAEEIDRQKCSPPVATTSTESERPSSSASPPPVDSNQTNTIDELKSLSPEKITPKQAEQCIREIFHRRTTFNDPDMRNSICGSLKHLGSDLYSSPVHFLHELIQNAEDNSYPTTVVPCLRIELDHSYILLSNNERGLRAQDVLAICSLAVSTKTGQQDQLGEKGVGFKSVFAASNQPTLMSHAWRFSFRVPGTDAMSYITPLWVKDDEIPDCITQQISVHPQDTYLYLPLKIHSHTPQADAFLNEVITAADPCVLLNMRHLEKLELFDKRENKLTSIEKHLAGPTKLVDQSNVSFEGFSFTDLTGCLIKLCVSSKEDMFRVYTCFINVPNSIEQRRSPTTRLILAFPSANDYRLTSTVYTGLPVCDLGFNFLFNADFQLVTNRENVRENAPFNTFIRDHLAALFMYLLLHDNDLRKDIHRYCPSMDIHQSKHSSWWHTMIDDINKLITKYLPDLFGIGKGKAIRHSNADLAMLVSNDQLYNCADIQVIDSDAGFLTPERLKSLQILPVSITDILNCFPNREEISTANTFRQDFRSWAEKNGKDWWSQFFYQLSQAMTSEVFNLMLQKPIFLFNHNNQRQYLPTGNDQRRLLFLSDDLSFRSWKRQITLLEYKSESEKTALLKFNKIQRLTESVLIKIIRDDHLQFAAASLDINADFNLIEEIWKDLLYLKSRVDKLDKTSPFLVPIQGTSKLSVIQNAILPTILGADIRSWMYPTTSPIIQLPYYDTNRRQLIDIFQWEYFLLEMNCQRPSIHIPADSSLDKLPLLPSFSMFANQECARLGQAILRGHTESTKEYLRQFPIVHYSKDEQQTCPVSVAFDENIIRDLPSLPRITIPVHCRALAIDLGVHVECDLRTCVTILQLLTDQENTNVDQYIQWLGHLQLYLYQQQDDLDPQSLLATCKLYLPDQKNFYSLKDLLIVSDNKDHHESILLVCKYLKLQWISPSNNQIYWQFKELFCRLGCICTITINHICNTIHRTSSDKSNFYTLGDCNTILTDSGMETMIILLQYLEALILACVKDKPENEDLYRAVIEKKHPIAPCGSRVDMEWRFNLTCNDLSKQLRTVTDIKSHKRKINLPTINRQLITKTSENIVYASLEMLIAQNLSKDVGKRYFIAPVIARTCPLVLATFDIDYVERRGRVEWAHENHNVECCLNRLTEIFRDTVNDAQLQVITAKYARVNLLLSDAFVIDPNDEKQTGKIDLCSFDTDFPFWIFDKTILLCSGYETHDTTKAIIAISALTTLLHKRKYIPFDEAKSIAQQKISACNAFRSDQTASIAGAPPGLYSYTDLLFPTDHQSIESMIISIGNYCTTERDPEEEQTANEVVTDRVAGDRAVQDQIYRSRAETQNHTTPNREPTSNRTNPTIVDGAEEIRIGQNAEHFFFVYLQKQYGTADVTPGKNWRSSSRLTVYPQFRRNVDDSAGFDFELHDTREVFARGSKGTTKKCYFEVKGTSGSYSEERTRFYISQNELNVCERIANDSTTRERAAYFIVIIENCLNPEAISLAVMIEWSSDFSQIHRTVDSYQCRIISSSSARSEKMIRKDNRHEQRQLPMNSNNTFDNPMEQSGTMNYNNAASTFRTPSHHHTDQMRSTNANYGNNNVASSFESSRGYYPLFTPQNTHHGQYQQMNYHAGYNNPMEQYSPTNNMHPNTFYGNPYPYYNQQQGYQPRQSRYPNNNRPPNPTPKKN